MKLFRTSALLALALAVAPAWAAKPFVAEYRASVMGGVSADARMSPARCIPKDGWCACLTASGRRAAPPTPST